MSAEYIENNFSDIIRFENIIENRITIDINKRDLISENNKNLKLCKKYGLEYVLIDKKYEITINL